MHPKYLLHRPKLQIILSNHIYSTKSWLLGDFYKISCPAKKFWISWLITKLVLNYLIDNQTHVYKKWYSCQKSWNDQFKIEMCSFLCIYETFFNIKENSFVLFELGRMFIRKDIINKWYIRYYYQLILFLINSYRLSKELNNNISSY